MRKNRAPAHEDPFQAPNKGPAGPGVQPGQADTPSGADLQLQRGEQPEGMRLPDGLQSGPTDAEAGKVDAHAGDLISALLPTRTSHSEQWRGLMPTLKKICPQISFRTRPINVPTAEHGRVHAQLFGPGAPVPDKLSPEYNIPAYLADLLSWAQQNVAASTATPASSAIKVNGRDLVIDRSELHSLGVFPERWELPLTAGKLCSTTDAGGAVSSAGKRLLKRRASRAAVPAASTEPRRLAGSKQKQAEEPRNGDEYAFRPDDEGTDAEAALEERSAKQRPKKLKRSAAPAARSGGHDRLAAEPSDSSQAPTVQDEAGYYWLDRPPRYKKKLPRGTKSTRTETIVSCHDCQAPHVAWPCKSQILLSNNKTCAKSYCYACCRHYRYLLDIQEGEPLQPLLDAFRAGQCPCCLRICCRKDCLRGSKTSWLRENPPPPPQSAMQQRVLAVHLLSCLVDEAQRLMTVGAALAKRLGKNLEDVPTAPLSDGDRLLCNRCATCLEDVFLHCSCKADVCPTCWEEMSAGGKKPGCPVCAATKGLVLQRALSPEMALTLSRAQELLEEVRAAGGSIADAYDFAQRTWRLLPPGHQAIMHPLGDTASMSRSDDEESDVDIDGGFRPRPVMVADAVFEGLEEPPSERGSPREGLVQDRRSEEPLTALPFLPTAARLLAAVEHTVQSSTAGSPLASVMLPLTQMQHPALPGPPPCAPAPAPVPAAPSPPTTPQSSWHVGLRPEDYRLAANRPGDVQNYVYTPHVRDFAHDSPLRMETVQQFVERWSVGEPIVIRGFRGSMNWGPWIVMRAARDVKGTEDEKNIQVMQCSDFSAEPQHYSPEKFANTYMSCCGETRDANGQEWPMFKVKDFPPENAFQERCRRHHTDFIDLLNCCMPEYMHPTQGALNLATMLPGYTIAPDLGPKGYIAFGREEEHGGEGDSVTKLHLDLADAINVLCHVQKGPDAPEEASPARCGSAEPQLPGYGGAGAVWDLFRREDVPQLRRFLADVHAGRVPDCPSFVHGGVKLNGATHVHLHDVIHDQCFMLTAAHRAVLAARYGVHSWHIEQNEWEGVVVPAGCPHQVRNLRACIKMALDFLSPESVGECMKLRQQFRALAQPEAPTMAARQAEADVGDRHFHDKLQASNMVLTAVARAMATLEAAV